MIGLGSDKNKRNHFKLESLQYGHTKIFFRAGILGLMEEIRDDRINDLVSMMQVGDVLVNNVQNTV